MKNEKPLVTINDECKFAESDWQENWHCEECKTRINKYCRIWEHHLLTQKQIYQYKTKCKNAVVHKDKESQTVYICGKNGGICDITKYKFCTRRTDKNECGTSDKRNLSMRKSD